MGDDPNQQGTSRRWIMQEADNSQRRLQTDYIDLYQIHRPSPDTDIGGFTQTGSSFRIDRCAQTRSKYRARRFAAHRDLG